MRRCLTGEEEGKSHGLGLRWRGSVREGTTKAGLTLPSYPPPAPFASQGPSQGVWSVALSPMSQRFTCAACSSSLSPLPFLFQIQSQRHLRGRQRLALCSCWKRRAVNTSFSAPLPPTDTKPFFSALFHWSWFLSLSPAGWALPDFITGGWLMRRKGGERTPSSTLAEWCWKALGWGNIQAETLPVQYGGLLLRRPRGTAWRFLYHSPYQHALNMRKFGETLTRPFIFCALGPLASG